MNMPRHVVHVVDSLGVGGLENGVVNLVNASESDVRHTIVCLTAAGPLQSRVARPVDIFTIGKRPGHDLGAFVRLVRLLRALRPDIVHSRNWGGLDAVPAARLAGVPVVVHGEHGRDIRDPDGLNARRNRLRRLVAPLVTRFVAVSRDLERWLVERVRISPAKVTTIHNGVDLEAFAPGDGASARLALGWPIDRRIVGTVGRLDPVKDQVRLVAAFDHVRRAHAAALLVIAGEGPCREALHRAAGAGGQVWLLGERRDVATVLRALDVFVLPSIAEGMSNTLLEAMATGLPLVATRVGGNAELIDAGVNGTLVPRGDTLALAAAINAYLDDPHLVALHGKASRERAVERFGLPAMRAAYRDLYVALRGASARGRT